MKRPTFTKEQAHERAIGSEAGCFGVGCGVITVTHDYTQNASNLITPDLPASDFSLSSHA